jgi:hypothetical protein
MAKNNKIVMSGFINSWSSKARGKCEKNYGCSEYQTHYESGGNGQIFHDVLLLGLGQQVH